MPDCATRTVVAGVLIAGASCHAATTYSERAAFEAGFGSLTIEDFEGIAPSGGSLEAPSFSGFSAESGTDGGTSLAVSNTLGTPSDVLFLYNADDRLIIEFDEDVAAVGFELSSVDFFDSFGSGDAVIEAYDSSDSLIMSSTVSTASKASMSTFFGIISTNDDIASIEIADAPLFAGYIVIDDLTYGVPAPGTLGLLGIAIVGGTRRRR